MSLKLHFRGALVGAVIGDCIGSVFEGLWARKIALEKVLKLIDKVEKGYPASYENDNLAGMSRIYITQYLMMKKGTKKDDRKIWAFTDDTAMARSVAKSLVENKGFNAKDMAKKFCEEYFNKPNRGYGGGVITVFIKLSETHFLDIKKPAAEQFDGGGSYGNGGAMRIVPASLFAYKDYDHMKLSELVENITAITHTHRHAIDGAILQSYAVDLALRGGNTVNISSFCQELKQRMKKNEEKSQEIQKKKGTEETTYLHSIDDDEERAAPDLPYCSILDEVKKYALQEDLPTSEEISKKLGTDVSAYRSVPAALYSFLRASKQMENLEGRNAFERTIILAITLGGDTDTIATMAGAIAGACYGIEYIPSSWQHSCEAVDEAIKLADELYDICNT